MQCLASISVKRPVFATVIILSLTVIGAFSFGRLGLDRFPKVDFPTVVVTTRLPGAAPEEVETEITDGVFASAAFIARNLSRAGDVILRPQQTAGHGAAHFALQPLLQPQGARAAEFGQQRQVHARLVLFAHGESRLA